MNISSLKIIHLVFRKKPPSKVIKTNPNKHLILCKYFMDALLWSRCLYCENYSLVSNTKRLSKIIQQDYL